MINDSHDAIRQPDDRKSIRERLKALLGYAGSTDEQAARRRLVFRIYFITQTVGQLVLTVVLTTFAIERGELKTCPEFTAINLLWVARTTFVSYLLLWMYYIRRRLREVGVDDVSLPASGQSTGTSFGAEIPPTVLCLMRVVSQRSATLHRRLMLQVCPVMTFALYLATQIVWIARIDHCLHSAPFSTALTCTISVYVNLGYAAWNLPGVVRDFRKKLWEKQKAEGNAQQTQEVHRV
ncbi:hypothetical protein C8Q77DRAFT_1154398 [Trametes polyzona]|nr:hypothetical protein C8Q77DRAFT_1154398 [Trametes polyzona]